MNDNQKGETLNTRAFYSTILVIILAICLGISALIIWISSFFFPAMIAFIGIFTISLALGIFSFMVIKIQILLRKISVDGINLDGIE